MPKAKGKAPKFPFFSDIYGRCFSEIYPEIEAIEVLIESVTATGEVKASYHFTKDTMRVHVPCGNPECRGGGYNLQEIIQPLYRNRITEAEDSILCRGYEKIGIGTRSCMMMAKYKIKIKYKQP